MLVLKQGNNRSTEAFSRYANIIKQAKLETYCHEFTLSIGLVYPRCAKYVLGSTRSTAIKTIVTIKCLIQKCNFMITAFAANGAVCSALIGFTRLSLSLVHSFTHPLTLTHPFTLRYTLFHSFFHLLAGVLILTSPFTLETTFPTLPPLEKKKNVIVYVIWILQHFTCPGFSDAAAFVARKSNRRRR